MKARIEMFKTEPIKTIELKNRNVLSGYKKLVASILTVTINADLCVDTDLSCQLHR